MAFNAQFFQLNPQSSLADDISSGYKAGYEMREGERKKALQNTYSKMLTSAGTLPTEFIQEAAKQGIGMEGLEKYFENLKGNVGTAKQVAEDSSMLEMLGRTPDAGREWNNQKPKEWVESKNNQTTPTKDYNTMTYDQLAVEEKDLLSKVSKIDSDFTNKLLAENKNLPIGERIQNLLKYAGNPTATKMVTPIIQVETPELYKQPKAAQTTTPASTSIDSGTEMDLGSGNIIVNVPKPIHDDRQYSAVEEMLRRSGKSPYDFSSNSGSDISNPVQYEKMGGNTGYADQYLAKAGLPNGQAGLDKAFEIYKSSVKAPSVQGKDGKVDIFATKADQNRYNAELAEAAKKFYQDIVTGNTTTIAEKVAQENLRIAKTKKAEDTEQHKADIGGRKAGDTGFTNIIRTRDVSKEEKTIGDKTANAYQDFLAAKEEKDPSIKGYQMSLAVAKANGNVNKDIIVANMVASGTIPNSLMIGVRNLMSDGGDIDQTALKALFGEVGSKIIDPNEKWVAAQKANMRDQLKGVGYDIQTDAGKWAKGKGNPAPKKTEKKEETREEKLKRLGIK